MEPLQLARVGKRNQEWVYVCSMPVMWQHLREAGKGHVDHTTLHEQERRKRCQAAHNLKLTHIRRVYSEGRSADEVKERLLATWNSSRKGCVSFTLWPRKTSRSFTTQILTNYVISMELLITSERLATGLECLPGQQHLSKF